MGRYIILFGLILQMISCTDEDSERLYTISGRLIDSTHNKDLSKYKIYAKSIFGSTEKSIGETNVTKDGYFEISYEARKMSSGNNLRLALIPYTLAQNKFEFLPYAQNWYKTFYIGDSSNVFIKLTKDLKSREFLYLITNSGNFSFIGPTNNKSLGKIRITNRSDYFKYYTNNTNNTVILCEPTGDPIVDTITLNINP